MLKRASTPRLHRGLVAAIALASFFAPAAAAESFRGTYGGEGMRLTLEPTRAGYSGTLIFDGEFYAVAAREVGDELRGSFSAAGEDYDFLARLAGETLVFEANSIVYRLRRGGRVDETPPAPPATPAAPAATAPPAPPAAATPPRRAAAAPPAASAPPPAPAATRAPGARDGRLAGEWTRGRIPADRGTPYAEATALELDSGGAFAFAGEVADRSGHWQTRDGVIWLDPGAKDAWRAFCRYRVVSDTLLCDFGGGARQLWHRR